MSTSSDSGKIGSRITEYREQAGLTQKELARLLKTSQSAVARMEKANRISAPRRFPGSARFSIKNLSLSRTRQLIFK